MRPNLRWQLLLATIGFGLILAVLSFQVQSVELCTVTVPTAGGSFVEGVVGAPNALNPLFSDAYPVDRELVDLVFDGLTTFDASGKLVPVLAEQWTVGEDGRSVRFLLREGLTWHDGEPVTANDVAFTYGLMQDATFPGSAALQTLWQTVTINVIDARTVDFILAAPYAPFLEATTRGILPAHILEGETAVSLLTHPFNQSPIGTGPFMVETDQDWRQTGRLLLSPNPDHFQQGTQLAHLEFRFFPDERSLLDAFANGDVQAVNHISDEMLPEIAAEAHVRLFTATDERLTVLLFNQRQEAENKLQSVTMRQALAFGMDRQAVLDQVLNGQGVLLEGPYLPNSWLYQPAAYTAYSNQPEQAIARLEENGWLVPEGQVMRWREGDPLSIRLVALRQDEGLVTAVVDQWATLGIDVQVNLYSSLNELQQTLTNGDFDAAVVDVVPSLDPDLYDFWSQEAIVRGQNYGGWNNRRASEALEAARQLWRVDERRPYYESFLRFYDAELPALTLYQHVTTYALSSEVNLAEIGLVERPRDRYQTFAQWFLLYKDVTVRCPAENAGSGTE